MECGGRELMTHKNVAVLALEVLPNTFPDLLRKGLLQVRDGCSSTSLMLMVKVVGVMPL